MSFPYPAKPWQDGQELNVAMGGGYYLLGRYNESKNLWSFRRIRDDQVNREQIFTFDVLTTLSQPSPRDKSPFDLTDPTNLQTQQDVNWFLWNYIRDLELEGAQVDLYIDAVLLEAASSINEDFENNVDDYNQYGPAIAYLNASDQESTTRIVVPKVDVDNTDWTSVLRSYRKGDTLTIVKVDADNNTNYRSDWEITENLKENSLSFSCPVKYLGKNPDHEPHFGEKVYIRLLVSPLTNEYVRKSGDTMTGPLVMNAAQGILMRDSELDFVRTGESLKDANGDPILEDDGKGNMVEQWDDSIERFSHIESLPPTILRSDGTYGADTSAPFGIRVEIDDGNTHRNRFVVGNRNGDAVTVTGGTGPNVQFGRGFSGNQNPQTGDPLWEPGEEGGIKITGIPTPTKENPDYSLAVNKGYVDERDEELRQEIIELEEEIDAIAPSVERGVWSFNLGGFANNPGQLTMTDGQNQSGTPIGLFKNVQSVWLNEIDNSGTPHGFDNVIPGDLIELFVEGDADYGLYTVVEAHDKTGGGNNYWVIDVDFVRTLNDTSTVNAGQNIRVKIFKAPTGGDASEFVLKSGDTMTGTLQMGKVTANTPNSTASPKIKFEGKTATGSTNNAELYYLGSSNYLYTNNNFYASGTVQSHSYGGFGYAGDTRMGFGSKTVDGVSSTKYGYLGIGSSSNTRAMEWSGSKGLQWLKAGTSGSQGQVLKKSRASGSNESRPVWQGVVDISPSGSNRCVGELWYNSNDQVLYVRIS